MCIFVYIFICGFPGDSDGKASACHVEDPGSIPGLEDPPEKEMAICSSTLAWKIPWMEEPGRLQFMGSQRVRHDWATSLTDHLGRLSYFSLIFSGTLNSDGYFFPFLLCLSLFWAICKTYSDNHFAFLYFFFLGMVLITTSCTMLWTSNHSFSDTLSDLIHWIYLSLPLYNCKGFDLGHIWMA